MTKRQQKIIVDCTKLMFTREHGWVFPATFSIFFCTAFIITDKFWIDFLSGLLLGYPLAILTIMSKWFVKENKEELHEVVKQHVEDLEEEKK